MQNLEQKLKSAFDELGIVQNNRDSINAFLTLLRIKDAPTYEHSVRVGLLSLQIAKHLHLDPKAMFYAGTLHDIGKILIPPEVLKKTVCWTEHDRKIMKNHSLYTHLMLRGLHEFSAEITLRHHVYQTRGYPKRLPKPRNGYSESTKLMINYYARLLSLADSYDAASTRLNDKFGEKRKLSVDEVKSIMLESNKDQSYLIKDLYQNSIFGVANNSS